jgi:hypothetical protein
MDAYQKVSILLAEYNTLRAEVLAARGNVAQAAGIFSTTFMANIAFAFSSANPGRWQVPCAIGAAIVVYFCVLAGWNEKNTQSFTHRLREIEAEINDLAEDRLLTWETDHGWGGMFWKTNPHFKGYTQPKPNQPKAPQSN